MAITTTTPATMAMHLPLPAFSIKASLAGTDRLSTVKSSGAPCIPHFPLLSDPTLRPQARGWLDPSAIYHQLRTLNEPACDHLVQRGDFEALDYAEHLLAVSADCRNPACAAGLGMARVRTP